MRLRRQTLAELTTGHHFLSAFTTSHNCHSLQTQQLSLPPDPRTQRSLTGCRDRGMGVVTAGCLIVEAKEVSTTGCLIVEAKEVSTAGLL